MAVGGWAGPSAAVRPEITTLPAPRASMSRLAVRADAAVEQPVTERRNQLSTGERGTLSSRGRGAPSQRQARAVSAARAPPLVAVVPRLGRQ